MYQTVFKKEQAKNLKKLAAALIGLRKRAMAAQIEDPILTQLAQPLPKLRVPEVPYSQQQKGLGQIPRQVFIQYRNGKGHLSDTDQIKQWMKHFKQLGKDAYQPSVLKKVKNLFQSGE